MNKKGQISETMTWVVATIVIFVILAIAVYAASVMSKVNRSVNFDSDDSPILLKKSLYAYLLTKDENQGNVFSKLEKNSEIDSFSEELGKEIFTDPSRKFIFSLKLNPTSSSGKNYEQIKINDGVNMEVTFNEKTTATI
jgi:hypothetical protein